MGRGARLSIGLMVVAAGLCAAPEVEAQAARVAVTVADVDGNPLDGVTVTVTCPVRQDYNVVKVTNKKGRVVVTHLDSGPTYTYTFEKDGFQTQVSDVKPNSTETTRLEVVLQPQAGRGEADGETAPHLGGGRAVTAFNEGAEARERGDLELAEKKFRQAAELSPGAAEPHIALAAVAHQRGDYAGAAAEAEKALAISPNNGQALLLRFDSYRLLGDADKEAEAAEALREDGDISIAAGTVFTEGLTEYRAGNTELAEEKFREALELDPEMTHAALMLGSMALTRGDPAAADAMAVKVLEVDPGNSEAFKIRYDALRQLGDEEGARQALDALAAADPEWAAHDLYNHAVELYNADEMVDATIALAKVIELKPDDARAHFLLGMAEFNLGRNAEAKAHLTRFIELAPDDPDAALAREMIGYASQ